MAKTELFSLLLNCGWILESEMPGINFFMKKNNVRVRVYLNNDLIVREISIEDSYQNCRIPVSNSLYKTVKDITEWKSSAHRRELANFYDTQFK